MNLPEVRTLLPQKHPFVFVDTLIEASESGFITLFEVKSEQVLVLEGVLTEGGLIENIAQTAAAGMGFWFSQQGKVVPEGFIGGIKDLKIQRLPQIGEVLKTQVTILQEVMGVTLIEGKVWVVETCIASCEMKIVINPNAHHVETYS